MEVIVKMVIQIFVEVFSELKLTVNSKTCWTNI